MWLKHVKWHGWAMLAALACLALVQWLGWSRLLDILMHPATASWVQAVGSIAAIGAAIWISHRQHERDREARVQEALEKEVANLAIISTWVFNCTLAVKLIRRGCDDPFFASEERPLSILRHAVSALEAVQPLDVPDWEATVAISTAIASAERVEPLIAKCQAEIAADDQRIFSAYRTLKNYLLSEEVELKGAEVRLGQAIRRRSPDAVPNLKFLDDEVVVHSNDPADLAEPSY